MTLVEATLFLIIFWFCIIVIYLYYRAVRFDYKGY